MAHNDSPGHCYNLILFLIILFTCNLTTLAQENDKEVSVAFPFVAVEVGDSTKLQCITTNVTNKLLWYLGDNSTNTVPFQEDINLRIYANYTEGTLNFKWTMLNDTGTYACQSQNGKKASLELHVYAKLTYYTEGMIIFGVNLGLVVIFAGCGLYTFIQNKRRARKHQEGEAKKADKYVEQKH